MRYLSLLFAFLLPTFVFAQAESSFSHHAGHVVLKPSAPVAVADFFPAYAKTLRTDAHSTWIEKAVTGGDQVDALSHHRFGQTIDGIPVLGATLIVHASQEEVMFATGKSYPQQVLTSNAKLSENEAIRRATSAFTQWSKRQRLHPLETELTGKPIRVEEGADVRSTAQAPQLVYLDRHYPNYTGSLLLAYEVEIGPAATRRAVYIDARSGKLITSIPLVAHSSVPGTVETSYYGSQPVTVEQEAPFNYRLVDSSRGVIVVDNRSREITGTSPDFARLPGAKGGMANDVFYGSSRFYDLLKAKFSWRGVDGVGEFFRSTVSDGDRDLVNAFWSGDRATFGGGNCHYGPLTTLDVVGHELAHGITQRTSNLVYSGQSGALNEGMSDIFGKALEWYEQPDQFNWILGNRFADSEYARAFRSMEDPTVYNNPKVVGGDLWNDGSGVHTNSGPLGHWFYLLVEGGTGINDLGTPFNVQPVGVDVAFDVAFKLNRDYLTETSGYQDAYTNCMLLVEAQYGVSSATYLSFAEAWKAIGMPTTGPGPTSGRDLAVFSFNSNSARYCHPTDSVELTVVLANQGDDLTAGITYTLTAVLDTATSTVTRTFDVDFLGGEIDFVDVMFPISVAPGQYRADVTVEIAGDIDPDNDGGSQTAYVLQAPHIVEIDGFNLEALDCFKEEREISINLLNKGCETYSGPVVIDIFDADDLILKTINAGNISLTPNELQFIDFSVSYDELEGAIGLRYDVPNDPLPEDNIVRAQLGRPRLTGTGDLVNFSENIAVQYVSLNDSRGHLGRISRSGRGWLATTGYYTTPFRLACLEAEANIEAAFDLSLMEMCVDFETEDNPTLAFDLQHFHGEGDPAYQGLVEVNRGLSVWTPSVVFDPVYIGSRADEVTNKEEVRLPSNYQGLVRFTFYNAAGSPTNWEMVDPFFEDYDYTFIDNIGLASVVETKELGAEFSILPNPARDYFTVNTTTDNPLLVEVINSIGQRMTEQVMLSTYTFSTGTWPNGIYQVRISDYTGAQLTETLMIAK